MGNKDTKKTRKSRSEGEYKIGKREVIIRVVIGVVPSLAVGLVMYFGYYQPNLDMMRTQMETQRNTMTKQVELMEKALESERIDSELWVLRDAAIRGEEKLKEMKEEGVAPEILSELQDNFDQALGHGTNADEYWTAGLFPQAWDEIDKSKAKFRKIIPIIIKPTFEDILRQ